MSATACTGCGDSLCALNDAFVCKLCARRYPPALLKATCDPFDYTLRLTSGEVIEFTEATIHGDYVTLYADFEVDGEHGSFQERGLRYRCPRGIDVRTDRIVWCADAPNGS